MTASILAAIVALFKAFPALEKLVAAALAERARAREVEAANRKQAKDAAVATWLNEGHPPS